MNSRPVRLEVNDELTRVLRMLLTRANEMPDGAHAVDYFPLNPWGDVELFRRAVYQPLHGDSDHVATIGSPRQEIVIAGDDVPPIRDVIDRLSDSLSTARPWVALSDRERQAVATLVQRLPVD